LVGQLRELGLDEGQFANTGSLDCRFDGRILLIFIRLLSFLEIRIRGVFCSVRRRI
jgi:hypothetical protein